MLYLALLCATLTAAIHFYIFYLELLDYSVSRAISCSTTIRLKARHL